MDRRVNIDASSWQIRRMENPAGDVGKSAEAALNSGCFIFSEKAI